LLCYLKRLIETGPHFGEAGQKRKQISLAHTNFPAFPCGHFFRQKILQVIDDGLLLVAATQFLKMALQIQQ
jgi:hypothetical protein